MHDKEGAFLIGLAGVLEVSPDELRDSFELSEQTWDSLSIMSVIALLDEHFGVSIPADTLQECTCVGDLLQLARSQHK